MAAAAAIGAGGEGGLTARKAQLARQPVIAATGTGLQVQDAAHLVAGPRGGGCLLGGGVGASLLHCVGLRLLPRQLLRLQLHAQTRGLMKSDRCNGAKTYKTCHSIDDQRTACRVAVRQKITPQAAVCRIF